MNFKLTNIIIEACLVVLIFNSYLAYGKKKKHFTSQGSEEIDEWNPESKSEEAEEKPRTNLKSPKHIDFRGLVRGSLAMHLALAEPTKNSVCSPISALLPLGKLVLGASGKTEEELLKAIGHSQDELRPALKDLIESLKQLPGVTLSVASKIYISRDVRLNPQFTKASKQIFHSAIEKADLSDPMETVKTINAWVKSHTNGMIPNLLSPADVPDTPSLILVNAVYFQGNWMRPFRSVGTAPFFSPMGTRRVPMMTATGPYNYIKDESLNAEILEIPYINQNASFVIVLPIDKNGLPMLLTALKLAPKMLNKAMKEMSTQVVQVQIPKFKVKSKINLKEMFAKFGITRMFKEGKELDKIVMDQPVHVSAAIQEAVLEVTEIGTEAAAATGTLTLYSGAYKPDMIFQADHPFLFFIIANGQPLFAGTYNSQSRTIAGFGASPVKNRIIFKADHPFLFYVLGNDDQLFVGTYTSV